MSTIDKQGFPVLTLTDNISQELWDYYRKVQPAAIQRRMGSYLSRSSSNIDTGLRPIASVVRNTIRFHTETRLTAEHALETMRRSHEVVLAREADALAKECTLRSEVAELEAKLEKMETQRANLLTHLEAADHDRAALILVLERVTAPKEG